jgi:protoheme ferro-lyase
MSPILATTAHWADWALHRQGFNGNLEKQPNMVFIKSGFNYIEEFITSCLSNISQRTRFILISGDSDKTIPFQTDQRFAAHSNEQVELLQRLHDDSRLISWFSQNIDCKWKKMHAIPLGYWEHGGS